MIIGDYTLHAVQTGLFRLDGGAMFGVVPKSLWSKTNPADDKNRIDMCMKALLFVSDKKKILIDNGVGYKMSQKLNDIYGVDHSQFTLEKSLAAHNIKPDDITDVIITHLHFDHVGGSTYRNPEGNLMLTFPNATHYIQKRQWEWANNPSERDKASYFPENFELIQKTKHLNLIEGNYKFDDYIQLHEINGHTPSQQIVTIQDDNTSLMYPADLIPMAAHVQLPYIMGYDLFPLTTLDEKKKYMPKLAEENWVLFFEHDPHTETARVEKTEKGFRAVDVKELSQR